MDEKLLAPIELDDDEIVSVAGGVNQTSTQTVTAIQATAQTASLTNANSIISGGSECVSELHAEVLTASISIDFAHLKGAVSMRFS